MNNKNSFTLIELLVVIAIVGILAGIIIVSMSGATDSANIAKNRAFEISLRDSLSLNLISEWKFDGNTTDGQPATTDDVKDTWGTNHGSFCTVTGSNPHPTPTVKTGNNCISNSCLYFDNIDDNIKINSPVLKHTGLTGLTISAWIKIDPTTTNDSYIVSNPWNGNGYYNYRFWWSNTTSKIAFKVGGEQDGNTLASTNTVPKDKWIYVVASITSDANAQPKLMKLYINGAASGSVTDTVTQWIPTSGGGDTSIDLSIGHIYKCDQSVSSYFFHGYMDEVKIYKDSIPLSLIRQNYLAGLKQLFAKNIITKQEYNQRLSAYSSVTNLSNSK
jgi:prepilin-type N-terminal cleavage/methylation domain-containing protein